MGRMLGPSESVIYSVLNRAWEDQASDMHLREGDPIIVRNDGELHVVEGTCSTRAEIEAFIMPMMRDDQQNTLLQKRELDFSCDAMGLCRLRVNIYQQRERMCAAIRLLPNRILSMEDLYLPKACSYFTSLHKGLVLVTGPTGSGKSTTLASMLDAVNSTRACHILTIEDPIEFVYQNKKAMISQRDVGEDTESFAAALRHSFRQDPDVVLVGEMRDLETMQMAITMAETGHLTFSTLHTGEAAQAVSRIVDSFPPHQQEMVRLQLASSLAGIISQQLLPLKDQKGRVAAREVLVANRGVRNLIRENKLEQITTAIQTGSNDGMFTMNHSLEYLYTKGFITYEVALQAAFDQRDFQAKFGEGGNRGK